MGHQADTASYYWTTFLRLDPARYRLTNPAKALGLTIPNTLIGRAEEVIE